jgi:uncharacterized membrane protein
MDRATRGLWLAFGGLALVPASLLLVALVPEGARVWTFLIGLGAVAAMSLHGGWIAKQAFASGSKHRGRAFVGAIAGLGLGLTAAMIVLWSALGLLSR